MRTVPWLIAVLFMLHLPLLHTTQSARVDILMEGSFFDSRSWHSIEQTGAGEPPLQSGAAESGFYFSRLHLKLHINQYLSMEAGWQQYKNAWAFARMENDAYLHDRFPELYQSWIIAASLKHKRLMLRAGLNYNINYSLISALSRNGTDSRMHSENFLEMEIKAGLRLGASSLFSIAAGFPAGTIEQSSTYALLWEMEPVKGHHIHLGLHHGYSSAGILYREAQGIHFRVSHTARSLQPGYGCTLYRHTKSQWHYRAFFDLRTRAAPLGLAWELSFSPLTYPLQERYSDSMNTMHQIRWQLSGAVLYAL